MICHAAGSDDPQSALIARGQYLARVGDCIACHSAPSGKSFAGGLPMATPLGTVYSTNITPDPSTGIGKWSRQDFERALREGVSKDGHNLYPAMPYPSYAKIQSKDVDALYAYFMAGVAPVKQANRPSDIPFPLNARWPLKVWNLFFLQNDSYQIKDSKSVEWNRGAYLVQGLGHCGACHTPRGVGFQEKALDENGDSYLTGAAEDNWFASNITGSHWDGLADWSEADIVSFLKNGANHHASAFGAMTEVINNSTQGLTDRDAADIAIYLKSLGSSSANAVSKDASADTIASLNKPAANSGAMIYRTFCMHCHGVDGKGDAPLLAPLAGNPNLMSSDPVSLINVTLNGTPNLVIDGVPAAYPMPKFGTVLDDRQIAEVLTFMRAGWGNDGTRVDEAQVAKTRKATAVVR
nr:cytochrome c [Paraburkholderia sp. DHOC27]